MKYKIVHGICRCRLMYNEAAELDQAIRNLTCSDLEIPLVVIGLGVKGLKKTRVVYLLGFLEERGEKWWCNFVCVKRLGLMIGLMLILLISFSRVVSMALVQRELVLF